MKNTFLLSAFIILISCSPEDTAQPKNQIDTEVIFQTFGNHIDLNNLSDYANQSIPDYISKDNTADNPITDKGATLGRVLFYDTNLSVDRSVACASCHQQAFAFSDTLTVSNGMNGTTGRHSMRLVNSRFGEEEKFFWDERAQTLEGQTTQPIQDHTEMGFSGEDGNPDFAGLIERLEAIEYYQELFRFVYDDIEITEERIQSALAQFIRSIQSFDTPYDSGRAVVSDHRVPFPNFTDQENRGKELFTLRPEFENGVRIGGGLGCDGCHRSPEFDIDPDAGNNGHISSINETFDTEVTRSPSLRELFNPTGRLNGPLMHDGFFTNITDVLDHYNEIAVENNNNLDRRLRMGGSGQNLAMTDEEREAVIAFLNTLSGEDIYTNDKWSDPFSDQ